MTTTHTFSGGHYGSGTGSSLQLSGPTTITATNNDGLISVSDEVTVTGISPGPANASGITEGVTLLDYHGTGTFDGKTGYVFSKSTSLSLPEDLFIAFEVVISAPELLATNTALNGFANGFTTQTLGSDPACFAAGTLITTPTAEVPVETLKTGDLIRTADGRNVPVKWVGQQTLVKAFAGAQTELVRIKAGVLGNHSDLIVTGDHGLYVYGYLINASALVNGHSINVVPLAATQTVFHIETEEHTIILANGAPAETFFDAVSRSHFDNHQSYLELYGTERTITEIDMPRIAAARLVPNAIKDRLAADLPNTLKAVA
ncbi:MAG: Hint domain-containing protein [Pseudomonadota bacterium]